MTREEELKQIKKSISEMFEGYTEADLVSFANFVVQRINFVSTKVTHEDFESWKESQKCCTSSAPVKEYKKGDCCQD